MIFEMHKLKPSLVAETAFG